MMRGFLKRNYKLFTTYYGLCIVLLLFAACGSNSNNAGTSATGTGAVAFSIVLNDSPAVSHGEISAAAVDCTSSGIATIEATIYDQSGNPVKSGGPWDCSLHSGTIQSVPLGDNRSLTLSGKDAGGNSIYTGTTTSPFTVTAGQTTNVGEITLSPFFITELTKLTASDAQAFDYFGESVSISGDYAIVGAFGDDEVATDAGAAYIFYRNQGGTDQWGQVFKLYHTEADAGLGVSVSISGDYAIAGADGEDAGSTDAGAVHILYKNQNGTDQWGEQKAFTADDVEASDFFGQSVSISGDYVIVGAVGEDAGGTDAGAAYIFYRNQGGTDQWGQVAKHTASNAQAFDYFGWSVSISGDYAIVGADEEDAGSTDAGAAYIYY